MKEFLTTGEAAALCSVTPDAVLKWVKAGKIPAHRTPGGHCRIHHSDLTTLLKRRADILPGEKLQEKSFQYCWEFNADSGELKSGCQDCIVYRSRAHRCYEMSELPSETGHAKIFCTESCESCDYYHLVRWQKQNLLIVTDKPRLRRTIESNRAEEFNLRFTDCEYHCSMVIESYRPDYVILDCSLGAELARQFASNIAADPRIPLVRIIMVGSRDEFPTECDTDIFALVERPL
jgi:excisionase family DNA binding protein